MIDSGTRTLTGTGESLYVASEEWGQPPASHHVIEIRDDRTSDEGRPAESIYVQTGSTAMVAEPGLEAEFAGWDIASDEALLSFEASLD